MNSIF